MWLYFNKNGQLLETLEHGSQARVGTTDYRIFAYFEGLDDVSQDDMPLATLSISKPDLDRTSTSPVIMGKVSRVYQRQPNESPRMFERYRLYKGYELDFSTLDGTVIFDQPGLFRCSISLYRNGTGAISVQGAVTISVGGFCESDMESEDLQSSTLLKAIYSELERKLPYSSKAYLKVVPSISETDFSDTDRFSIGDMILNSENGNIYELTQNGLAERKGYGQKIRAMTDEEVDAIVI